MASPVPQGGTPLKARGRFGEPARYSSGWTLAARWLPLGEYTRKMLSRGWLPPKSTHARSGLPTSLFSKGGRFQGAPVMDGGEEGERRPWAVSGGCARTRFLPWGDAHHRRLYGARGTYYGQALVWAGPGSNKFHDRAFLRLFDPEVEVLQRFFREKGVGSKRRSVLVLQNHRNQECAV